MKKYIEEIVPLYFPIEKWEVVPGPSGENNTTLFILAANKKYVLRIYETHQDEEKVNFEHAVLLALKEQQLPLSFPVPVRTKDGQTLVKTQSGSLAGLFKFLNGVNPDLKTFEQIYSFGKATGQLTEALAKVSVKQRPVYRPYYDMDSTHPKCSLDQINDFSLNPPEDFVELAQELLMIHKQLVSFQNRIPFLKRLPHRLVHGDLNASNILTARDGSISAILDFEFVTHDLRVMEVAVSLSDFIDDTEDEKIIFKKIESFLSGYGSRIKLTEEEMNALPLLIQLRSLDVFIHFLGRYWDGVDSIETVKKYIRKAARRVSWILIHQEKFR
ncbi:phosphotransferase [Robertmurraya korlensis]|uniref:phosphotransferase n=1 Tax=Robertmurraya korlensis TaxID=519977 RepID=UPI0020403744|nr:phosphotransferase [Robertmurraya korlensis]MCM3600979.1 phosphotransferase [Robertmurraya korlensis]